MGCIWGQLSMADLSTASGAIQDGGRTAQEPAAGSKEL